MVNWLFVDLNSYFASVEQQLRPELRGRPVGVVPMMAETTCCLAASYQAKKFGVKTGTLVAEARKMCPGIVFVQADHRKYVDYHNKIVAAVESCHPVTRVMSIDEMSCRLGGRDRQLDNAIALGREVKRRILDVGECLTSSVGISTSAFLAKVASDMQKPDGLTVMEQHQIREKLLTLKLRDLPGIGANMERRLHNSGITKMEQLLNLDQNTMRSIWGGMIGERFYRWIRGEDIDFHHCETPKSIGHSSVLAPALRTTRGAYAVCEKLLHKVAFRLRQEDLWTRGIALSIRFTNQTYWRESLRLHECQDTHSLNQAFLKMWKSRPPGSPLKVSLTLYDFISSEEKTASFFDDTKKENLSHAMDEINKKYGKNLLYLADMHEAVDQASSKIAFSSIPKYEVD